MTSSSPKRIPWPPARPFAFLFYLLRHCSARMKRLALGACAGEIIAAAADLTVAWELGRIVGVIAAGGADFWPRVLREIALLAALWTLRSSGFRLREWMERRYVPELLNTTRELLFNRLIQQNQAFIHANFAGVLANHVRRAADTVGSIRERVQGTALPLVTRLVTACFLLWNITPLYTAFILAFLVICLVGAGLSTGRWTALSTAQAEKASRLSGYVTDSVTNLSLVQQNVGWREEQQRLGRAHEGITQAFVRRGVYASWFWGAFDTIMTFFFCGFMALLAWSWQQGDVTTAQLAMCVGVVTGLFGAMATTVWLLSMSFDDVGLLEDALGKIATPLTLRDADGAAPLRVTAGEIEFRDVDFGYAEGRRLFDGLSLRIPGGQKVGFVGISGAGKTTLCSLLMRAYDVSGGGIYIDGQNIAQVTQDSLHAAIAVIPQDPALFHRTLAENIRYSRPGATDEEVRAAAKDAAVEAFIDTLPEKYETLVGERGIKLSGGQRQRIAIARAIVKDAGILVLDEATSALDSETEQAIQSAMARAMKGRTTLVVAHRLSTLSRMDRIIVLEQGRIIEDGSFEALLEKHGHFHKLWSLQAGGFLPETA